MPKVPARDRNGKGSTRCCSDCTGTILTPLKSRRISTVQHIPARLFLQADPAACLRCKRRYPSKTYTPINVGRAGADCRRTAGVRQPRTRAEGPTDDRIFITDLRLQWRARTGIRVSPHTCARSHALVICRGTAPSSRRLMPLFGCATTGAYA